MIRRELSPLSSATRALLIKERNRPPENEALRQRVLARARDALQGDRPSGVSFRLASGPAVGARAPRTVLLVAAALAVASLAAAGASFYRYGFGEAPPPPSAPAWVAPVVPPGAVAVAPPGPAGPSSQEAPLVEPKPAEPRRAPSAVLETPPPTSIQTYAVELGVLEPARSSIARGQFAGALTAIARHQREFPRGQLAQEREALRVRALWGMGQKTAAENAAAAFRKRYPRSGLLSWMKEPAKPQP